MIRYLDKDPDTGEVLDRIVLTRGEGGSLDVSFDGYAMREGDQLILRVRELPNEDSPLVFESVNENPVIRFECDATKDIPAGKYSGQIILKMVDSHCPVQIWPEMNGSPNEAKNIKNVWIQPEV